MEAPEIAAERVARGARWLDENFPGWEERIDPSTLELSDGQRCICGQVFARTARMNGKQDGFMYAYHDLFTEANSWISGLIEEAYGESKSKGTGAYASAVSRELGFSDDSGYRDFYDDEYVSYSKLQYAWEKLLANRGYLA